MKRIYIIIGLLLSLTSCNNWLDIELDNKVDDQKLFSTAEGFHEAMAGVYSELSKPALYGRVLTMEYVDLLGQYYNYSAVGQPYEYWKNFDYQNSSVKSSISLVWKKMYQNIAQLNCILEWSEKNGGVLSEDERNQIRGEALGLRAYLHFDLYRLFSPDAKLTPKAEGIPYNKRFGVSLPPMYTAEETLQLVINDLKEAEEYLAGDPITEVVPYTITTNDPIKGIVMDAAAKNKADKYVARMNLYAVKATLARVYQARGEFGKAVEKAKEVIDSEKFRLLDFTSIDQDESMIDLLFSDEHIFSLRNKELESYSQRLHQDVTSGGMTAMTLLPFTDVMSLYESNNDDVRLSKWFHKNTFMKYSIDSTSIFSSKMPMIKLSEMYLLISECSLNSNKEQALQYINELRDHRIRNNFHWATLTPEYVREEMRREYIGEGQFWYVYKRNNLPIPDNGVAGEIEASNQIFVFPLPDAEIEDGHREQR